MNNGPFGCVWVEKREKNCSQNIYQPPLKTYLFIVSIQTKYNLASVSIKEIQIILRLFLVCHLLLQTKSVSSQLASNMGGGGLGVRSLCN